MMQRSVTVTEVARGFWARDAVDVGAPEEVIAAAERICVQLQAGLVRWVGTEGYRALLHRVLELARPDHPALSRVSCNGSDEQEIAAAVRAHGAAEVTAGMVALVATLIDLLGRTVGEEMAVELVNQAMAASPRRASNTRTEGVRND
ncbi:MAG: hypothetical protein ABI703_02925 [Gemmatimonadales bacterium]